MHVLGIETSTRASSVALGTDGVVVASEVLDHGRGHLEFTVPAIRRVCDRAGIALDRIDAVVVGTGPGLFTGMRVGVTTAKAIAQTLAIPIVPIPSLDALAYAVRDEADRICATVDARRGEMFAAFYVRAGTGVERTMPFATYAPDALAAECAERGPMLVAGDGMVTYRDALAGARGVTLSDRLAPRADDLVAMARLDQAVPVEQVEPLYVRKSEAEIRWEERGVTIERPDRVKVPKRAVQ